MAETGSNVTAPSPQTSGDYSWLALIQLVLSLLAFFLLLSLGSFFVLMGIGQLANPFPGMPDITSTILYAAGLVFASLLMLPSAAYAFLRLTGRKSPPHPFSARWLLVASGLFIFLFPLVVVAGNLAAAQERLAWVLLPPFHILAVTIPIFWLVALGLKGLCPGSKQRAWGLFSVGLSLGPALILTMELALLTALFVLVMFFIAGQPELANELENLAQRLQYAPPDPEVILRILQPFISNPVVISSILLYIALFVPLIEEATKPIGVWFLAGRNLSPVEGFAAGLLSGAGYALFENLFLATASEQWTSLVLARLGTGAVHIFTTSLVGWGLASAWSQGRYLRLGLSFAGAVSIHGLWNGLTLLNFSVQILPDTAIKFFGQITQVLPLFLGLLAFLCVLMLWLFNHALKRAIIVPLPPAKPVFSLEDESTINEV